MRTRSHTLLMTSIKHWIRWKTSHVKANNQSGKTHYGVELQETKCDKKTIILSCEDMLEHM